MKHIVLLGDSVFDNGAYVAPYPDVRGQLQDLVAHGWRATLNAADGAMLVNADSQVPGKLRQATERSSSETPTALPSRMFIGSHSPRCTTDILRAWKRRRLQRQSPSYRTC